MTCIEFAAERSWTTPSPSAATEAAAHDRAPTFPHGWRLRDRALLVFALSSPFHFSHPYSPPYVERARANSSGKERAKERAKTEIGDTESHPEIRKSCLLPVHFGWSRLGDLNPGPTHYETTSRPHGDEGHRTVPTDLVPSRRMQTRPDRWSWGWPWGWQPKSARGVRRLDLRTANALARSPWSPHMTGG